MADLPTARPPRSGGLGFVDFDVTFYLPLAVLLLAVVGSVLWINDGFFCYSLDDPYIHLALADQIRHGHFGINAGEASSPSSSILWPLLLAALPISSERGDLVPLLINSLCSFSSLAVIARVLRVRDQRSFAGSLWLGFCVALAINAVGLILTGMEHSLQVLLTLTGFWGVIEREENGRFPAISVIALILAPLIRYENLAVTMPICLYLAFVGQWKKGVGIASVVVTIIALYSAFLISLGLPPLPTSILAKAGIDHRSATEIIEFNLRRNLQDKHGLILLLLSIPLAGAAILAKESRHRRVAATAVPAVVLHYLAGQFGWFSRYEIYVAAMVLTALIYVNRKMIWGLLLVPGSFRQKPLAGAAAGVLFLGASFQYSLTNLRTPAAAHEIYTQQSQMSRFAKTFWGGPVAVNDLGLVSFKNPSYVLDLWGLGSLDSLRNRMDPEAHKDDARWLSDLTSRHAVEVVMIYKNWFSTIPAQWTAVGELSLDHLAVVAGGQTVTFYSTSSEKTSIICDRLQAFSMTLPQDSQFKSLCPSV